MASVGSKTDQIVVEKLEETKKADGVKLDGEENTATLVSEEKPESENVSNAEGLEKSEKTNVDSNSPAGIEANVKGLEDETGAPEEEKKESSNAVVVPDVSEATEDLNAPTKTEVSIKELEVQSAFPEEQKQEKATETQEPKPDGDTINSAGEVVQFSPHEEKGSGDAEAVMIKEESLEEIIENPVETLEPKTEAAKNSADLSAAEVPSDQGEAPEIAQIVKQERDMTFNTEKEGIEATFKDPNIIPETGEVSSKNKEVSASNERKSESLKDVDATSVKVPKEFATVEESPEQLIEENKNESPKNDKEVVDETSNVLETSEFIAEVVKDIGSSEMVEEKKNDPKDQSVVEKNAPIPDDNKKEPQIERATQIATDKSEKKELGVEKEESEKSKDELDPIASSDTSDTKLIKDPTKRESNLLSKVKRSIVKAKKAILGKSPGPKTVSSEIKDENT